MREIQVSHYTKRIKDKEVLKDINYTFRSGIIYGLYGRNGSGKTMLLRALAGLIYATEGEIRYNDKVLHKDIDFPEDTGIIIENMNMLPQYTGFDNLKLLAEIKKIANDDDIRFALESVGLDPEDKRKVKAYSLGMKQKLVIAQAIFEQQKILLLDEPTNALDEESILKFRNILLRLKEKGCLIIIASHNKEDISILCNKVLKMDNGKLCQNEQ